MESFFLQIKYESIESGGNFLAGYNGTHNEMGISPDEVEIIGSWFMVKGRMTETTQAIGSVPGFGNSHILKVRYRAAACMPYLLQVPRRHKRNTASS
jgi:hypothetical protein